MLSINSQIIDYRNYLLGIINLLYLLTNDNDIKRILNLVSKSSDIKSLEELSEVIDKKIINIESISPDICEKYISIKRKEGTGLSKYVRNHKILSILNQK